MGMTSPNSCMKGPACQALDALSASRPGMVQLQAALGGLGPSFAGIENVLATNLLPARRSPAPYSQADIDGIRTILRTCWFDPTSPTYYFPIEHEPAKIYGLGMLKTLDEALTRNVPIDSWWALDHAEFDMLNLATAHQVTLVIATPRPAGGAAPAFRAMAAAGAPRPTAGFSTRSVGGVVQTTALGTPRQ